MKTISLSEAQNTFSALLASIDEGAVAIHDGRRIVAWLAPAWTERRIQMDQAERDALLLSYSNGQLRRRELEDVSGLWFGDILHELTARGLALPRRASGTQWSEVQRGLLEIADPMQISLIVTDASPLITLAVAGELDTLTMLGARVIVPDVVKHEVVRHIAKPDAQALLDWLRLNDDRVAIGSTEEYEDYVVLLAGKPHARLRNRGELAAVEILARELRCGIEAGILLFEDSDLMRATFLDTIPSNVLLMSTSTFLDGLQARHCIASADAILDKAVGLRGGGIHQRQFAATTGSDDAVRAWEQQVPG